MPTWEKPLEFMTGKRAVSVPRIQPEIPRLFHVTCGISHDGPRRLDDFRRMAQSWRMARPRKPAKRSRERLQFPDIDDLRDRLRFRPEDGSIYSGDVRMTLVHVPAIATLRRELIDALGVDRARGVFTRVGYAAGTLDAEIVRKVRPGRSLLESFAVGPQLQSLEGT